MELYYIEEEYKYIECLDTSYINSAQELHYETLNMMGKYQVVFIKFEAAIMSLAKIRRTRQRFMLQRAFTKYRKKTALMTGFGRNYELKATSERVKDCIGRIVKIRRIKALFSVQTALNLWRRNAELNKETTKLTKEMDQKLRIENEQKSALLSSYEAKAKNGELELKSLKGNIDSFNRAILEKTESESTIRVELKKISSKPPLNADDGKKREKELLNRIKLLEEDNKNLNEQLESTEANVSSFMEEIVKLMQSKEFTSTYMKAVM